MLIDVLQILPDGTQFVTQAQAPALEPVAPQEDAELLALLAELAAAYQQGVQEA